MRKTHIDCYKLYQNVMQFLFVFVEIFFFTFYQKSTPITIIGKQRNDKHIRWTKHLTERSN